MKKHKNNSLLLLKYFAIFLVLSSCSTASKINLQGSAKWENEISALEKLDKTESYPSNSILCVGSSSIRLWNDIKEDLAPYPVIRRGFGGSKSPDVLKYIQRLVYPHQFGAMVLFVANDLTGSPNDLSPKESKAIFGKIIRTVREKYPSQPIFIIQITPSNSRWKYWPLIAKTNEKLRSLASDKKHIYFIETEKSYLNEKGEPKAELFIKDQLHLNREGYKIWGRIIKNKLDEVLK